MQNRRKTIEVRLGELLIGGSAPISVQSMTTVPTIQTEEVVAQILRIAAAGGQVVRLTTQGQSEAENMKEITRRVRAAGCSVPLVADVHFTPGVALTAARYVDGVRINPGNWGDKAKFVELLAICRERGVAIRVGVNHGSLAKETVQQWGDTPRGMVESALEFLEIARAENFDQIVVSFKSSNVRVMVDAYRLGVEMMDARGMNFPLHLGLTEAGEGIEGRIKSAVGLGALLVDGLGDTIRVSLTEEPEAEIPAAFEILQASRARISKTEIISCPGCGRTLYDLQNTTKAIKERFNDRAGLKIAVMGCIVNGPGEMADADYGYVGAGPGLVTLYKDGQVVERNIEQSKALDRLQALIDG
ncbi:MAG: (E)-4-hydroxy-3-methylbut-2-enyl-diphosphate synthase [Mucinivorans sp.]